MINLQWFSAMEKMLRIARNNSIFIFLKLIFCVSIEETIFS